MKHTTMKIYEAISNTQNYAKQLITQKR